MNRPGDFTVARGAHVGQQGYPSNQSPFAQAAAAQAGAQCASPAGQQGPRRVLGNFTTLAVGATGPVNITTQVPVIMRCISVNDPAAPFGRVASIFVGTINHLVGGTVPLFAFVSIQRCTSLIDGIPLVPGMTLQINVINIGGFPLLVDFAVDAELMCP